MAQRHVDQLRHRLRGRPLIAVVGVRDFLLVQLPITLLAATVGVWLFYVQHQFEETWWERGEDWTLHAGALHGSSHYDLPRRAALVHRQHRHPPRASSCEPDPGYRLGEALRDHPELREVSRLTLVESFACLRLALWDEDKRRLVSFREARSSADGGCYISRQSAWSSPGESTEKGSLTLLIRVSDAPSSAV